MARIPFSRTFGTKIPITRDQFEGETPLPKVTPMRPVVRPTADALGAVEFEEQALVDHEADRAAYLKACAERGDAALKVVTPAQPKG